MIALVLVIIQYIVLVIEIVLAIRYARMEDSSKSDKLFYWIMVLLVVNVSITTVVLNILE